MQTTHTRSNILALAAVITITLTLAADSLYAVWSAPPTNPPDGNVATPIHTGSVNQIKEGALGVSGLTTFGGPNIFYNADGTQSFEIRPGFKGGDPTADYTTLEMPGADTLYVWDNLEVNNKVQSDQYCDQSGNNCLNFTELGGGEVSSNNIKRVSVNNYAGSSDGSYSETVTGYNICFLTKVDIGFRESVRDDDSDFTCDVRYNSSKKEWQLFAKMIGHYGYVKCQMMCN